MARKKKKKPVDSGPAGAPDWVVTFTDMISLLVTFFVLLMTFSSLEEQELRKVSAFLKGQRGSVTSKSPAVPESPKDDLVSATNIERGALLPHARPSEKLPEALEDMGQKMSEQHLELDLGRVTDGLVIDFDADSSFGPGSATPSADLSKSLLEIGRVLENYTHLVVVEGFTDDAFRRTPTYPDAESLSFARANAAAELLVGSSKMVPEIVQVAGYGASEPRVSNDTAEGRRLNRRIRIRILSLSRLHASWLSARTTSEINDW